MNILPQNKDFMIDLIRGRIPKMSIMEGLGERENMQVIPQGEDIWRGNDLSPAPTSHILIPTPDQAGEQMTVVSENSNDSAFGTGVRTVGIEYLDVNGKQQTELLALNGTTPVNTIATNIKFVNNMHSDISGDNNVAVGHIKIYRTGSPGLVYSMIESGGNHALVPHKMVPAGHTLILQGWHATEAQARRCAFRIRSTDFMGVLHPINTFLFKDTAYINNNATGDLSLHHKIPAGSIVKVTGWGDVVGAEGSCHWHGVLIKD